MAARFLINKLSIYLLSIYLSFFQCLVFFFASGIETDELDSNAEEFEDESVEFFVKEEITEVEE